MKLIPEWRRAWRMFSVQAQVLAMALLGTWGAFPEDLKARLPEQYVLYSAVALLVFGVIGRLVQQPNVHGGEQ